MKKIIFLSLLVLAGCARSCQSCRRDMQVTRHYEIFVYSGDKEVFHDSFEGILNGDSAAGFYYFKGDTMIEIAGTYIIRSRP